MSGQLGASMGISVAAEKITQKARGYYGQYDQFTTVRPNGTFYSIHKSITNAAESDDLKEEMLFNGRFKKWGIFLRLNTLTGQAKITIRKNGVDLADPNATIFINSSDATGRTYLSLDNIDIEFLEKEQYSMRMTLVSGTGSILFNHAFIIEWDSDVVNEGDFESDIYQLWTSQPISLAIRKNIYASGAWLNVPEDALSMPVLYDATILDCTGHVATGFGTTRTHFSSMRINGVNKLSSSWIIGETGTKTAEGIEAVIALTDEITLNCGQSGGLSLEPQTCNITLRMVVPE